MNRVDALKWRTVNTVMDGRNLNIIHLTSELNAATLELIVRKDIRIAYTTILKTTDGIFRKFRVYIDPNLSSMIKRVNYLLLLSSRTTSTGRNNIRPIRTVFRTFLGRSSLTRVWDKKLESLLS